MSEGAPSQEVASAIEAGITTVTRRVEIFEADGVTPWYPNGSAEDVFRLTAGNVSVDSQRDERRSLDMTLDNKDNNLRPDPDGGFWYDKIIRPWRGVRYASNYHKPRILIIESQNNTLGDAVQFKSLLVRLGYPNVDINLNASTLGDLSGYLIIASSAGVGATQKAALLASAYSNGFSIFTQGASNGVDQIPFAESQLNFSTSSISITPPNLDTPLAGGWSTEAEGTPQGVGITALSAGARVIATHLVVSTPIYTAILKETSNARWFQYTPTEYNANARILIDKAIKWLWNYAPYREWEMPLGDYLIDRISTKSFPGTLSITGRDFTKKCMKSKIERNMAFEAGTSVNDLIRALGSNAGIGKFKLSSADDGTLGSRMDISRTTDRWKVMKDAAAFLGRDIFFDVNGFLTTRAYADPTLGSPVANFKTGRNGGNLSEYDRSTSDDRIYNHIVVTGEAAGGSEEAALSFYGEAINDNLASPTNIHRIGTRTYFYTSSFFTSDQQCIDYAKTLLTQTAFEQYELSWSGLVYPWLDAGVVVDFDDPDRKNSDPTRFLMDTLSVPLGLEKMPGTGKRVLFIEGESEVAA